jgi:hypothetical protein
LKYFKSDKAQDRKVALGVINFDHFMCVCEPVNDKKRHHEFQIEIEGVDKRQFIFKAMDEGDNKAWTEEIRRHIAASEGFRLNKSAKGLEKPWRFDNVSEK